MEKTRMRLGILFLAILLVIPFASAEIFLEQPAAIYNLGDDLKIDASVDALLDNYFNLDLYCNNGKITLLKDILSSTLIKKSIPLSKTFIGTLGGKCYLFASYGDSSTQTQSFTISDRIDASIEMSNRDYNPSDLVMMKIEAIKANGLPVEGFASIIFDSANISLTKIIQNGTLETGFAIPDNIASGTYSVKVEVYEKDKQNEKTNHASLEQNFFVNQEPRRIEIAIATQEAKPNENFDFKVYVYDQVNASIITQVAYEIYDNESNKLAESLVESDSSISLPMAANETPGQRSITANMVIGDKELSTKRWFYVLENEAAQFDIINSTLRVENTGNVPYNKNVEVEIGGQTEIVKVSLNVGEVARFSLHAPEGTYNVKVRDGVLNAEYSGISLTGNAVKVIDADREAAGLISRYPIVWIFIIAVFGFFIFTISKGFGKSSFVAKKKESEYSFSSATSPALMKDKVRKELSKSRSWEEEDKKSLTDMVHSQDANAPRKISSMSMQRSIPILEAEHALVLKGEKEEASIIAIKIKNRTATRKSKACLETIEKAIEIIQSKKGAVYAIEEYIFGIFTAALTRTYDNASTGVKIAQAIEGIFNEHNKKFKERIDFGLALNVGNLIVKPDYEEAKLKFTSLGNSVALAKKVSEISDKKLLLSEDAHKRTMATIKVRKETSSNLAPSINIFSITQILDREQHDDFLRGFLKRNK